MIGITIESIAVGDSAQITRRVTDGDIAEFVDAVGDHNPVHADREYAASTAAGCASARPRSSSTTGQLDRRAAQRHRAPRPPPATILRRRPAAPGPARP